VRNAPARYRAALQNAGTAEQTFDSGIDVPDRRFAVPLFMTLVVEDDSLQREVLADVLKQEGLEVIECTTAEAAELVLATTGLELRALVTDVQLAGEMSGIELAEYARRKYPDLNVIVMSGRATPNLPRDTHFLQKPFRAAELLQAINVR
jgi:DNA-binding NtrC family response regulator